MSALLDYVKKNGRAPQVSLVVKPITPAGSVVRQQITISQIMSYSFEQSVLIPVDAFSFAFKLPLTSGPLNTVICEGDLVEVVAGNTTICTGIVDTVDMETTIEGGDVVQIHGRNLVGQLEDQSTVNGSDTPLWGNSISILAAVGFVIQNTRIRGLAGQQMPVGNFLFATEPGESKLSALIRFVEPLNCLIWGDPSGNLIVGRPNMGQAAMGDIYLDRTNRKANVTSIKAVRSSTQIPNIVIPVWSGQESVQKRVAASQRVLNPAQGPSNLRQANHLVQKCVVVSTPSGSDPQSLSDVNAIKVGGSNILQAYALREIARANITELQVQANVRSHYNDDLSPFLVDQVYNVNYPAAGVTEKMYLYQVEYTLDANGARTSLSFCRLGCIVAGISTSSSSRVLTASGSLPKS